MFELKRSEILQEEVKINGEVITTNLNLTKNAKDVFRLARELQVLQVALQEEKNIIENLEKLGEKTIEIIKIFFGENANKVLDFYSDISEGQRHEKIVTERHTEEMLIEVIPFLFSLVPKIKEFHDKKQKELNKQIKGRKVN
jgi:hypothetical protein